MSQPLVEVAIFSYNHGPFVGQAIESVLNQKTSFPVRIIVADDGSTDHAPDVIRDFASRYPAQIVTKLFPDHAGLLTPKRRLISVLSACEAEYVGVLEADDYWTDTSKLQKQVDFLQKNPEYSMCCTNYSVVHEDGTLLEESGWPEDKKRSVITHLDILERFTPKMLTIVFRRKALTPSVSSEFFSAPNGDSFFSALISESGPVGYLDFNSGSYRRHEKGIWSLKSEKKQKEMQLKTFMLMRRCFKKEQQQAMLTKRIVSVLMKLLKIASQKKCYFDFLRYYTTLFICSPVAGIKYVASQEK